MRKSLAAAAATVVVAGAFAGGAAIAGSGSTNAGAGAAPARLGLGHAQAPKARLVASVNPDGSVDRSKAVKRVTNPSLGLFCIKPKASARINVNRIVPSVTVEWDNSSGDALMAHWRIGGASCNPGWIAVQTVNGSDGSFDVDTGVAFTLVVP